MAKACVARMWRVGVCLLLIGSTARAEDAGLRGRPQVPLAGEWKVQFVQEPGAAPGETWETKPVVMPKTVSLPGRIDTNNPSAYKQGAWLQREAAIPADWQGRRIVLGGRDLK